MNEQQASAVLGNLQMHLASALKAAERLRGQDAARHVSAERLVALEAGLQAALDVIAGLTEILRQMLRRQGDHDERLVALEAGLQAALDVIAGLTRELGGRECDLQRDRAGNLVATDPETGDVGPKPKHCDGSHPAPACVRPDCYRLNPRTSSSVVEHVHPECKPEIYTPRETKAFCLGCNRYVDECRCSEK